MTNCERLFCAFNLVTEGGGGVSKKTFIFVTLRYWCNDTVASQTKRNCIKGLLMPSNVDLITNENEGDKSFVYFTVQRG